MQAQNPLLKLVHSGVSNASGTMKLVRKKCELDENLDFDRLMLALGTLNLFFLSRSLSLSLSLSLSFCLSLSAYKYLSFLSIYLSIYLSLSFIIFLSAVKYPDREDDWRSYVNVLAYWSSHKEVLSFFTERATKSSQNLWEKHKEGVVKFLNYFADQSPWIDSEEDEVDRERDKCLRMS